MGLTLEIGLPSPNPIRQSRLAHRLITAEEHARDRVKHVAAAAHLGCRHARIYLRDRHDRFNLVFRWVHQLNASLEVLRWLEPTLIEHRVALAIETHADATSGEIRRFLDLFDPAVVGVTIDTGNLPMRLEDPIQAAQALAPRVLAVRAKDAVLVFAPRGLCWQARPVGSGIGRGPAG